jgi:hypothetical protein
LEQFTLARSASLAYRTCAQPPWHRLTVFADKRPLMIPHDIVLTPYLFRGRFECAPDEFEVREGYSNMSSF